MAYKKKFNKDAYRKSKYSFANKVSKYVPRFLGGASGAALGFIGGNVPGAVAGWKGGWNAGKGFNRSLKKKDFKRRLASNPARRVGQTGRYAGKTVIGSNPGHVFGSNPGKGKVYKAVPSHSLSHLLVPKFGKRAHVKHIKF